MWVSGRCVSSRVGGSRSSCVRFWLSLGRGTDVLRLVYGADGGLSYFCLLGCLFIRFFPCPLSVSVFTRPLHTFARVRGVTVLPGEKGTRPFINFLTVTGLDPSLPGPCSLNTGKPCPCLVLSVTPPTEPSSVKIGC